MIQASKPHEPTNQLAERHLVNDAAATRPRSPYALTWLPSSSLCVTTWPAVPTRGNPTLDHYLEALAGWIRDLDGWFTNQGKPIPTQPNLAAGRRHAASHIGLQMIRKRRRAHQPTIQNSFDDFSGKRRCAST